MAQAKRVSINQRDIGNDSPPYICAEISANHNGKLERALADKPGERGGADAVKIQTYRPDTITLILEPRVPNLERALGGPDALRSI